MQNRTELLGKAHAEQNRVTWQAVQPEVWVHAVRQYWILVQGSIQGTIIRKPYYSL